MRAYPALPAGSSRPPARVSAAVLSVLVAAFAAVGLEAPAAAAPSGPETAATAAGWLTRQLTGGDHLETTFDGVAYPDQGLTADAVLAFDAAGVSQDAADRATAWLAGADVLGGYIGDGDAESYAGSVAKVAVVAEAQGVDPEAFGGVDLLARLRALQQPSGRFTDRSAFGDFSNGITQSFAVLALHRAGGAPAAAVDYLVASQCGDGGFPLTLEAATCASDPDATGFAVQALLAADQDGPAGEALDYLEGIQGDDGGLGGAGPTSAVNANSTGVSAAAFRAGGRDAAADRAVAFLTALQVGCDGPAADRGAVAYAPTGFDPANAVRATTQAVPGLAGVSLSDVTAEGADAGAPTLPCTPGSPSPSASASGSPTATPSVSASASAPASATPTAAPTAAPSPSTSPVGVGVPAPPAPGALPRTGGDLRPVAATGAGVLVLGVLLLVAARVRRRETS